MNLSLAFSSRLTDTLHKHDYNYVVTGATGWIGRVTLEMLALALGSRFIANVQVYGRREMALTLASGTRVQVRPLSAPAIYSKKPTILFHYAFLTKDKIATSSVDKYREANRTIRDLVLRLAASLNMEGIILASSGAVYDYIGGKARTEDAFVYGHLKYEDEQIFGDWCNRTGTLLVVPRIFNISGPYINKFRSYALSAIISNVFAGKAVQLTAGHLVYRSYVSVIDVIEIALLQILAGCHGSLLIYDTCGTEVIELGQLASEICDVLGRPELKIERPILVVDKEDRYVGNPSPWIDILMQEKYSLLPLRYQIKHTAQYMHNYVNLSDSGA